MGANESKLDDVLDDRDDATANTGPHVTSPPLERNQYHSPEIDTQNHAGSGLVANPDQARAALTSSNPQRLPPVDSRETVRSQAGRVTRWRLVDSSDALYESLEDEQRSATISLSPRSVIPSPLRPNHLHDTKQDPSSAPTQPKKRQCSPVPQATKRQRILPTPRALEIAHPVLEVDHTAKAREERKSCLQGSDAGNNTSQDSSGHTEGLIFFPEDATPQAAHEPKGYQTVSPTSFDDVKYSPIPEPQDGDLVMSLSQFHKPNSTCMTAPEPQDSVHSSMTESEQQEARDLMIYEQTANAQRSRELRQQALVRAQSGTGLVQSAEQVIDHGGNPTFTKTDPVHAQANDSHAPDILVNNSDTELEALFAIAKSHMAESSGSDHDTPSSAANTTNQEGSSPIALNPASRAAAERFRTQHRHLDNSRQGLEVVQPESSLHEREQRLLRLKALQPGMNATASKSRSLTSKFDTSHNTNDDSRASEGCKRISTLQPITPSRRVVSCPGVIRPCGLEMLARKRAGNDFWSRNDHREASRTKSDSTSDFEKPNGRTEISESGKGSFQLNGSKDVSGLSTAFPSQGPVQHTADTGSDQALTSKDEHGKAPIQTFLSLPKNFHELSGETQAIIFRHEKAKASRRDLEAIERVMVSIANLRCLGDFSFQEERELRQVQDFVIKVLRENKPGQKSRKRIQDIRVNMENRARGHEPPSQAQKEQWIRTLFDEGDLNLLKKKLARIDDEVTELGTRRSKLTIDRHRKPRSERRKTVRFLSPIGSGETRSPPTVKSSLTPNGYSSQQNRRNAQYAAQDRQIESIRAKLKLFEAKSANAQDDVDSPSQSNSGLEEEHEKGSDWSEDEGGAEHYLGPGIPTPNAISRSDQQAEIIPDVTRDDKELTQNIRSTPGTRQGYDHTLVQRMREKNLNREQTFAANKDALASSDAEGSTSSSSCNDSTDSDEEPRQLFRYTVFGVFYGINGHPDHIQYRFKSSHTAEKAEGQVRDIITKISKYCRQSPDIDPDNWSLNTRHSHGLMEQHLQWGPDNEIEARVCIEKKLVNVSEQAYRRAKRRSITKRTFFVVRWEKTKTLLQDPLADMSNDADADELFGSDTTPPPAPQSITTSTPTSELRYYDCVALANRHAVNQYLPWHYQFLPGLQNEHYRRLEHENAESQLERLGDWGLWSREETLKGMEVFEDPDAQGIEGDDGEGETDVATTTTPPQRFQERCKVWVEKILVMGPGN